MLARLLRNPSRIPTTLQRILRKGIIEARSAIHAAKGTQPNGGRLGLRAEIAASGLFDAAFYAARYPEIGAAGALDSFIDVGLGAGHQPSADFDPALYLRLSPDLAGSDLPALLHFIRYGRKEGRPRPDRRAALKAEILESGLFDAGFYAAHHPDIHPSRSLDHFIDVGLEAGHPPSADFDPHIYARLNPDVVAEGEIPLLHFMTLGRAEGRPAPTLRSLYQAEIASSGLFDAVFYAAEHPGVSTDAALDHYMDVGLAAGYAPSRDFDPAIYLRLNPDVASGNEFPFLHFIIHGRPEGRPAPTLRSLRKAEIASSGLFDAVFYAAEHPGVSTDAALDHYMDVGLAAGYAPSRDFDPAIYLRLNPDVASGNEFPFLHFIIHGRPQGRPAPTLRSLRKAEIASSGLFDAVFYAAEHPGVSTDAALDHYVDVGLAAGYAPSRDFDPAIYLRLNPDVASGNEFPFLHFIIHGRPEGRPAPTLRSLRKAEIASSGLFDAVFYAAEHPGVSTDAALDHYVDVGLAAGYAPSRDFDPAIYLRLNPDVASGNEFPFLHFIIHGRPEGRPAPTLRSLRKAEIASSGLFDAVFYAAEHPGVSTDAALDHYVDVGLAAGYAPSRDFDPAIYLRLNPDVASSGLPPLLHFIAVGRAEGRPAPTLRSLYQAEIASSGLFDAVFYAAEHPGVSTEAALDHYVDVGLAAGYAPSRDFDPAIYLRLNPDVASGNELPFLHFIIHGRPEGRRTPTLRALRRAAVEASGLFDSDFYGLRYPRSSLHPGDALDHYLDVGAAAGFRPSLAFDPRAYRDLHPDVAKAGVDPLEHYIDSGRAEGRALPKPLFTLEGLLEAQVRIAQSGLFDDAFYRDETPVLRQEGGEPILHYLLDGSQHALEVSPSFSLKAYRIIHPEIDEQGQDPLLHYLSLASADPLPADVSAIRLPWKPGQRRHPDHEERLEHLSAAAFFARFGFTMETSGPTTHVAEAAGMLMQRRPLMDLNDPQPDVSIIIPVYGQLPFVLSCLESLSLHDSRYSAEIIVSDDVSPESHQTELLRSIPWISYERRQSNGGFLDNCNGAARLARGRHLVLLNSDTRVVHGWLDELIGSFALFPKAGFVGSKLLNADGTLQEAGGLYWSDGTAWNYGRDNVPGHPRFSFARQVDWVSGASIAIPSAVWREVGGFDEAYRPAYCEDVDLAFRIREQGYEVWYQPLSRVIHFEGMTHGRDDTSGIKAYQRTNLQRLKESWSGRLPGKRPGGHDPHTEANRSIERRMLVIDANIHMPDRDAGSVVASQIMRAYRELGYHQTFVPLHGFTHQHQYTETYQREGVEVIYEPFYSSIQAVLDDHGGYDYVLMFRYATVRDTIDAVRAALPRARVVFSNVDLHFLRNEREAAIKSDRSLKVLASQVETEELAVFAQVDCSLVHTPEEATIVNARLPVAVDNMVTFPWVSSVTRDTPGRTARRDIMFLGGFPHTPNVDAALVFAKQVWPRIVDRLPRDARFLVVGNAPPREIASLASDRIVVTGYVPDVEPYLAQARVFVAPLRYGAGIKGKVIQSLAHGVPTVASAIAVEGIPVRDGRHFILADDADAIAEAVMRLYETPDLWEELREAGLAFIEDNYSWAAALALCERSLDVADATWMTREERARRIRLNALLRPEADGSRPPRAV